MSNDDFNFESFLDDNGVMIVGADFTALNYGSDYSEIMNGGMRKVGISGRESSYFANVLESVFPKEVLFEKRLPYSPLREASHVEDNLYYDVDFNMRFFLDILKHQGWRFPD